MPKSENETMRKIYLQKGRCRGISCSDDCCVLFADKSETCRYNEMKFKKARAWLLRNDTDWLFQQEEEEIYDKIKASPAFWEKFFANVGVQLTYSMITQLRQKNLVEETEESLQNRIDAVLKRFECVPLDAVQQWCMTTYEVITEQNNIIKELLERYPELKKEK